jgi:hypothetical protein
MPYEDAALRQALERRAMLSRKPGRRRDEGQMPQREGIPYDLRSNRIYLDQTGEDFSVVRPPEA